MKTRTKQKVSLIIPVSVVTASLGLLALGAFLFFQGLKKAAPKPSDLPVTLASGQKPEYVPGELLVKYRLGVDQTAVRTRILGNDKPVTIKEQRALFRSKGITAAAKDKISKRGVTPKNLPSLDSWQHLTFQGPVEVKDLVSRFAADPDVESVDLNYVVTVAAQPKKLPVNGSEGGGASLPNDFYLTTNGSTPRTNTWGNSYPDLWGLWRLGLPSAWSTTTGSSDVVVAVTDTGVDYTHEDLAGNIWLNPGESGTDALGGGRRRVMALMMTEMVTSTISEDMTLPRVRRFFSLVA